MAEEGTDFLWDDTCSAELAKLVPTPQSIEAGKPAFQREANLFSHKAGIMACGGFDNTDNGNERCQFWQPGMTFASVQ